MRKYSLVRIEMRKGPLTARQLQILEFIENNINQLGYPPTVREIGAGIGLNSFSTIHIHLQNLQAKGYIKRDPIRQRAITVLKPQQKSDLHSLLDVLAAIHADYKNGNKDNLPRWMQSIAEVMQRYPRIAEDSQ